MPTSTATTDDAFLDRRLEAVGAAMRAAGAGAFICVAPDNQTYLSGFRALLYSRPILLFIEPDQTSLVVPGLEETHARGAAHVDHVDVYYEHPEGGPARTAHDYVRQLLDRLLPGAPIGVELDACPAALAFELRAAGHEPVDLGSPLRELRMVKDASEVALIEHAARIVERGVAAALATCAPGVTELEIDAAGTAVVQHEVSRLGRELTLDQLVMTPSGAARSTLPHAYSTTRRLESGDVLIHTRQVALNGYRAELERTVLVPPVDRERRRVFDVMREAHQAAIAAVRPGVSCADVDRAARTIIADAGLAAHAVHRSGHGIGLSAHEAPYLRFDDPTPLAEGMVVTVEPGIYVPGLGGFRHSDTVLITADGARLLTAFPTDVDSLTANAIAVNEEGDPDG